MYLQVPEVNYGKIKIYLLIVFRVLLLMSKAWENVFLNKADYITMCTVLLKILASVKWAATQ